MYEIYAYGNNDSLYGIFNAIAAIMGANSYLQAIAMVAFCGFVTAAIAYAFMPHKLIGWQWLASVLLVYSILFVPKVTVGIVDKLGTQPVQVVSNVPFGVAFFGNLTSTIGNTLTEVFETAFQTLPGPAQQSADLTYQRHGVMFGNTLIKRTRQIVFDDPNFRTDLVNFIHNCTMFDLADGTIDPATFSKAPVGAGDLWSLMATPNPARFSSITTGGVSDIQPCPAVYANLNARLPAITNLSVQKLAALLNPNLPLAQAVTEVSNQASASLSAGQLGKRGDRRCRHRASERTHQCDQRHERHHRAEDQRSRLAHPRAWSRPGNRPDQRGVVELREDGRGCASAHPQCDRGDHLCPLSVGDLTSVAHLRSGHDESAPVVSADAGVDPTLAAGLRDPQLHGLDCQRQAHRGRGRVGRRNQWPGHRVGVTRSTRTRSRTRRWWAISCSRFLRLPGRPSKACTRSGRLRSPGPPVFKAPLPGPRRRQRTGNVSMGMVSQDQVNLSPTYSSANARFSTDAWGTRAETIRRRRFGGVRGRATEHEPARDAV